MAVYLGDIHLRFEAKNRKAAERIMNWVAEVLENKAYIESAYWDEPDLVPEELGTAEEPTHYETGNQK